MCQRGAVLTIYALASAARKSRTALVSVSRGVEPDECYIFGTEQRERPDLAIEVEWTHGGIDKLAVYEKLGVEEVWYWLMWLCGRPDRSASPT